MSLSPQFLDELRSRITLSGVISRTTRLQKAGHEWKACCPFHDEKSPSFTVNDQKGFYHCFGCGAHGDAIRWMTDQRGLGFMDAVKELAAEAGMELPAPDPRAARAAEQRASLHDVMQAAQDWFAANLRGPEGEQARAYLHSRGFPQGVIDEFGFGFAPENRQALKNALSRFPEAMLIEAGLRITVEGKEPYDRFRNRLMLPIQDARGRVIAFGGRILDAGKSDAPKYLNSPDTPLFDKGRTLYNLHRAGPASRKSGRIVVVEGYMDVVALAAAGIADAVAPLGTALTERQLELLWRVTDVPVLCFDGDAAGQRAAMRAIGRALPMLAPGRSLAIVNLPAGLDPDDLIRERGAAEMERLLSSPKSLLNLLWDFELNARALETPEDKAGLKARLLEHVETITDPDIKALYRRELLDRFSAFAFPRKEFTPQPARTGQRGGFRKPAALPVISGEVVARLRKLVSDRGRDTLTAGVIAGLVRFPDQIQRHAEALLCVSTAQPHLSGAVDALLDAAEALESGAELPIWPEGSGAMAGRSLPFSFLAPDAEETDARSALANAVGLLIERPALEAAVAKATARFESDPEGAFAEQQRLLKRKLEFEARLGQMAQQRAAGPDSAMAQMPASDEADEQKMD
ncbi:MAG: DNA primase [Novosphingobium sp.]